jgi:hypothetical protein
MLMHEFLLKQSVNGIILLLLLLPRLAALVPGPMYYTEFQVSTPATASLLTDLYSFLAELCRTVPGLPCSISHNVSLT